jgi:hypothetical protein
VIPSSPSHFLDSLLVDLAIAAVDGARAAVLALLSAFGASTEPDFASIVPAYDRTLAIALLLVGAFTACALIEKMLGGPLGAGWAVIPRTVLAVFCACAGLEVVQYLAGYAALLATAWSPDLTATADKLAALAHAPVGTPHGKNLPLGGVISLIFVALLMDFMAVVVYLELIVRAALTLIVTAFIPIVCAMAIWPRLAGAITHLCEFVVGLVLSKFVIATVSYIGFGLVVSGLAGSNARHGEADWIVTGVAILCIAAFSPVVMIQALRFTHATAGSVARGWIGSGASMSAIATRALGTGGRALSSSIVRRGFVTPALRRRHTKPAD